MDSLRRSRRVAEVATSQLHAEPPTRQTKKRRSRKRRCSDPNSKASSDENDEKDCQNGESDTGEYTEGGYDVQKMKFGGESKESDSDSHCDSEKNRGDTCKNETAQFPSPPRGLLRESSCSIPYPRKGTILKIRMINWMAYTGPVDFNPSDGVNLIAAVNGCGKSAIVCAIAIGLGFPTNVLMRSSDLSGFIKRGAKNATLIIDLAGAGGTTRQVMRKMWIDASDTTQDSALLGRGVKTKWYIDDRPASLREVKELQEELKLQVGNVVSFLPQERVGEFSTLTPSQLFRATFKAIDPDILSDLDTLKELKIKKVELSQKLDKLKERDQSNLLILDRLRLKMSQFVHQRELELRAKACGLRHAQLGKERIGRQSEELKSLMKIEQSAMAKLTREIRPLISEKEVRENEMRRKTEEISQTSHRLRCSNESASKVSKEIDQLRENMYSADERSELGDEVLLWIGDMKKRKDCIMDHKADVQRTKHNLAQIEGEISEIGGRFKNLRHLVEEKLSLCNVLVRDQAGIEWEKKDREAQIKRYETQLAKICGSEVSPDQLRMDHLHRFLSLVQSPLKESIARVVQMIAEGTLSVATKGPIGMIVKPLSFRFAAFLENALAKIFFAFACQRGAISDMENLSDHNVTILELKDCQQCSSPLTSQGVVRPVVTAEMKKRGVITFLADQLSCDEAILRVLSSVYSIDKTFVVADWVKAEEEGSLQRFMFDELERQLGARVSRLTYYIRNQKRLVVRSRYENDSTTERSTPVNPVCRFFTGDESGGTCRSRSADCSKNIDDDQKWKKSKFLKGDEGLTCDDNGQVEEEEGEEKDSEVDRLRKQRTKLLAENEKAELRLGNIRSRIKSLRSEIDIVKNRENELLKRREAVRASEILLEKEKRKLLDLLQGNMRVKVNAEIHRIDGHLSEIHTGRLRLLQQLTKKTLNIASDICSCVSRNEEMIDLSGKIQDLEKRLSRPRDQLATLEMKVEDLKSLLTDSFEVHRQAEEICHSRKKEVIEYITQWFDVLYADGASLSSSAPPIISDRGSDSEVASANIVTERKDEITSQMEEILQGLPSTEEELQTEESVCQAKAEQIVTDEAALKEYKKIIDEQATVKEQIHYIESNMKSIGDRMDKVFDESIGKVLKTIQLLNRRFSCFMRFMNSQYEGSVTLSYASSLASPISPESVSPPSASLKTPSSARVDQGRRDKTGDQIHDTYASDGGNIFPTEAEAFSSSQIVISVRYKDGQKKQPLSSSRQSGGERSVATMLYMLALQALNPNAFRVLDEINQGLDCANERRMFELFTVISDPEKEKDLLRQYDDGISDSNDICSEDNWPGQTSVNSFPTDDDDSDTHIQGAAQYLIFTPHMLSGVDYTAITLHYPFNGPYVLPQSSYYLDKQLQALDKTTNSPSSSAVLD